MGAGLALLVLLLYLYTRSGDGGDQGATTAAEQEDESADMSAFDPSEHD